MVKNFDVQIQNKLAYRFSELHDGDEMLILPNVWDCTSAKIFEELGFPALATTSSGVAWSLGFKDGEHVPPEMVIEGIKRITNVIDIPLTADIEGGYYRNAFNKQYKFFEDLIEAGAVGVNLEDATSDGRMNEVAHHCEIIRLAKEAGRRKGVNLFVNARTDAYERTGGDLNTRINACIDRAKAYEEAGADGIFVPFVMEMESIAQLKKHIKKPLNVLINNNLNVAELKRLKVNRVTIGGKAMVSTLNLLRKIGNQLKNGDNWDLLYVEEPTYPEVNGYYQ